MKIPVPSPPPLIHIQRRPLVYVFLATVLVSTLLLSTIYVIIDGDTPAKTMSTKHVYLQPQEHHSNKTPVILLWTTFFQDSDWLPDLRDLGCPLICKVTSNRHLLNVSDALVFHVRDVVTSSLPDPTHTGRSKWVLFNLEAPPHTTKDPVVALDGKVHWTVSYRKDSDLYAPYGSITKKKVPLKSEGNSTLHSLQKKHIVCWIVSNCDTPSDREGYVDLLQNHIPVRIWGKCGKGTCPTSNSLECYEHIAQSCKFYLAFENSLCKDYVTEKVFQALKTSMVPIVLGDADYKTILPPHSYINALDFGSPKLLADFLVSLDKDDQRFDAYSRWKSSYQVVDRAYRWACELCALLHGYYFKSPTSTSTKRKLVKWWFDSANCHAWNNSL